MTNTRNTPVEVLEMRYPVRVRRYALRWGINRLNDETLPPRSSREAGPSDRLRIETPGGDWGKPILQKD
jgi:N-methylhydantoinase B